MDDILGDIIEINGRKFVKLKLIGQGGFSYVHSVLDVETKDKFALKTTLVNSQQRLEAATREVTLLGNLAVHPNIVEYYEHQLSTLPTKNGQVLFALFELCEGGNLSSLLQISDQKLSSQHIIEIFIHITAALDHLHSQNPPIFHRDVKLENILFSSKNLYKLCDFGSATHESFDTASMQHEALLQLEQNILYTTTNIYRAPEMADLYLRRVINHKADIWSLGCIVYTLLFNCHPFDNVSTLATSSAFFDLPYEQVLKIPEYMLDVVFWCLTPNPDDRPSAKQLLQAIPLFKSNSTLDLLLPQVVLSNKKTRLAQSKDQSMPVFDLPLVPIPVKKNKPRKSKKKKIDSIDFNTSWTTTTPKQSEITPAFSFFQSTDTKQGNIPE